MVIVEPPPIVEQAPVDATTQVVTHTIWLNRHGLVVRPGLNNAATDTSSLVGSPKSIPAYTGTDAEWATMVACVRAMYERFDVEVTDTRPPATVDYMEAVFGGRAPDLGLDVDAAGVAPFRSDCGVIEHAIVFAFTARWPHATQAMCEVAAQEIGHAYGLDHELDAADPMTYLAYNGRRTFQDRAVSCGEFTPRPCGYTATGCRPSQNSVAILEDRLGPSHVPASDETPAIATTPDTTDAQTPDPDPVATPAGCTAAGDQRNALGIVLAALVALVLTRTPARGPRSGSRRRGSAGSAPGAPGSCASSSTRSSG